MLIQVDRARAHRAVVHLRAGRAHRRPGCRLRGGRRRGRSGPYIAIPLFVHRYHDRYVDQFLPIPLGLTAMADYVGTVAPPRVSPLCRARRRESRPPYRRARRVLTAGFAGLIKPSNLIYIGAPIVVLLSRAVGASSPQVQRRMAPALIALALWKYRGYGVPTGFYLRRGARRTRARHASSSAQALRRHRLAASEKEPRRPPRVLLERPCRSVAANCRRHCRGAPVASACAHALSLVLGVLRDSQGLCFARDRRQRLVLQIRTARPSRVRAPRRIGAAPDSEVRNRVRATHGARAGPRASADAGLIVAIVRARARPDRGGGRSTSDRRSQPGAAGIDGSPLPVGAIELRALARPIWSRSIGMRRAASRRQCLLPALPEPRLRGPHSASRAP